MSLIELMRRDATTIRVYYKELLSYSETLCFHAGLDKYHAEDIAQNTMSVFLQQIENGQLSYFFGEIITWAKGIAKNKFYEVLRKEGRQKDFLSLHNQENLAEEDNEVSDYQKEIVEIMLAHLNKKERYLIELFYYHGYSDKQILEKKLTDYSSKDVIKTLRCNAIKKLKKIFPNQAAFQYFDYPQRD